MVTPWDSLPDQVREQADRLILEDRRLEAVHEIWRSGVEPGPSLVDCQDMVADRQRELGDRIRRRPEPHRDVPTLIDQIQALSGRPVAIEASWDGDSRGWFVVLAAVLTEPEAEVNVALIRHGSDLRLLNGQVPPWPEAEEADGIGRALAQHFDVPFHFPSPDTPDDDAPRWRAR